MSHGSGAVLLLSIGVLALQGEPPIITNPRGVAFTCPDHDRDDGHEIAIVPEGSTTPIQVIAGGDPAPNPAGEVEVLINVQPIAFGRYVFRARALAAGLASEWSEASLVWQRAPGKPSGVVAR